MIFPGCSGDHQSYDNGKTIFLRDWEIDIGQGWMKSAAVPWDWPVSRGGAGAESFNGHGWYRTRFILPPGMEKDGLAFFTESIDDADITFLNGHYIGETGRVPVPDDSGHIRKFRSSVYEPRLYIIPAGFILPGKNTVEIHVFDYSGTGGFSAPQVPVIGPAAVLMERAVTIKRYLEMPRSFLMGIQILTLVVFGYYIRRIATPASFGAIAGRIRWIMNPYHFLRPPVENPPWFSIEDELVFRYSMLLAVNSVYLFLILSQMPVKYSIIESEVFWFFVPMSGMYIAFLLLVIVFHQEAFGLKPAVPDGIPGYVWNFFRMLTHPFFQCLLVFVLLAQPLVNAWGNFMKTGVALMSACIFCLFSVTAVNLVMTFIRTGNRSGSRVFLREGILRLFLMLVTSAMLAIYLMPSGIMFFQAPLVVIFSTTVYLFVSVMFYARYNVLLPIVGSNEQDDASIAVEFPSSIEKMITVTEDAARRIRELCMFIDEHYWENLNREELASTAGMNPDTLSRLFNQYTGKTLPDYINECRVNQAVKLLLLTDLPVTRISMDSGFENIRTFNRVFKKHTGSAPSSYRQRFTIPD